MSFDFDIIVIGGGHAGVEASMATSGLGLNTALISMNLDRLGYMSCNPSIGGLAKGHMVREIDILGGVMGWIADETCIQYKRLNSSKGPAVRGTRVQSDKDKYSALVQKTLSHQENLKIIKGEVKQLLLNNGVCGGVILEDGSTLRAKAVIVTTGTFMNGVMHMGSQQTSGGRLGDKASIGLSDQLKECGFTVHRLKTGTPARLLSSSINWEKTIPQWGDQNFFPFSLKSEPQFRLRQIPCNLSRTTAETHEIIRKNLDLSPLFCGAIVGQGPRYCPSIEDKITRFAEKESHQTFLEPEGLDTDLIYLQGISTSLPADVQDQFLKTIPGLENVKVARYGYAVEYDYIEPTQIWHSLETRPIRNLFLAGQINGTSGYEEAASQGLVAGINAARLLLGKDELVLKRDEAYIGVLIDDLVTKGTQEPYRMFTSRAEHRLVLREDNTIDRLMNISVGIGLSSPQLVSRMQSISEQRGAFKEQLKNQQITPKAETQDKLLKMGTSVLLKSITLEELLRRPEVNCSSLLQLDFSVPEDPLVADSVEIDVKYSGYIKRQMELIESARKFEELLLPSDLDYFSIRGLSTEEKDKLKKIKPRTLGQAQRISGVNPSAIQAILVFLKGRRNMEEVSFVGKSVESALES